jgi:cytochrome P450
MTRAPHYSSQPDELFNRESIENPHALYARLREQLPISRVADTGVHLLATWDLIEEALARESDFSANITGVLMRGDDGKPSTFELPQSPATQVIATADEPHHAVHRAIAQPRLAASQAAKLEEPIRDWARSAIDEWLSDGAGDFIPIAERIPARVVAHVLGLPDEDVSRFRKWAMTGGDILAGDVDGSRLGALAIEALKMAEYLAAHFDDAYAKPRVEPDAPLLHALARGVRAGEIERAEAIGIAAVMFGAGGESTAALIGSVTRCLAERSEVAAQLRQDPKLIPRFVEEVSRLEPPFKFHYRAVRRECELGGFELVPGDRLMLLWASANRDAEHVEDPDALRLDRRHPKSHLSFGRGGHFCIGAPLARLEARIVCEELLARTHQLAVRDGTSPSYTPSIFVRRLDELVLTANEPSAQHQAAR